MKNIDIHIINEKYYNYNGKNPDKPLTDAYGKRLYNTQKKYGSISIKEASGHGLLSQKREYYKDLITEKSPKKRKKDILELNKINTEQTLKKDVDILDLRTRFRAGFKVYDDDEFSYESLTFHKALDGFIPLERFIKELPDDVFSRDNIKGGFKYVVYNKNTKKVIQSYEYGEQD